MLVAVFALVFGLELWSSLLRERALREERDLERGEKWRVLIKLGERGVLGLGEVYGISMGDFREEGGVWSVLVTQRRLPAGFRLGFDRAGYEVVLVEGGYLFRKEIER